MLLLGTLFHASTPELYLPLSSTPKHQRNNTKVYKQLKQEISNIFVLPKPYQAACLLSVIRLPLATMDCTAFSFQNALFSFYLK